MESGNYLEGMNIKFGCKAVERWRVGHE